MIDQDKIQQLIDKSKRNDKFAFGQLVLEYQELVFRLAFRLLCHEDEARDMVQEVFVKVWQSLDKYDETYRFSTWIYKITSNICYDRLRSLQRSPSYYASVIDVEVYNIDAEEDAERVLFNQELCELILQFTRELTPKQKMVFTLRDIEDLDVQEVMTITGMSAESIKQNLYHARKNIRNKINQTGTDL